ncbi:MAG: hypothetical protein ACP5E9_07270 [Candidatus Methanospirareceae archaeon]
MNGFAGPCGRKNLKGWDNKVQIAMARRRSAKKDRDNARLQKIIVGLFMALIMIGSAIAALTFF